MSIHQLLGTIKSGGPPPTSPQTLSYGSNGDPGVFNFLGRNYGVAVWTNPYTAGRLGISSLDNTGSDLKATIVNQAPSQYSTGVSPNGIIFDLGLGNSLVINYYSYRYRDNETTYCPTAWTIEGSNDGVDWSHIVDTVTGETSALSKWVSRPITGETVGYRFWRFKMTGNNNSGTTQSSIGEFEIYGVFTYGSYTSPLNLIHVSNGDTNGVCHFRGTANRTIAWANPHTAGRVTVSRSSTLNGANADLVDRALNYNTTDNAAGEWMKVDLGSGNALVVKDYTLQNGSNGPPAGQGTHTPRNWKLQGSNDNSAWTDIDSRTNNTDIAATSGAWGKFTPGSVPAAYRYLRILATGINNGGDSTNFLQIGEFEFYGTFTF